MSIRVRPAVAVGALVGRLLTLAPGVMPRSMLVAVVTGVLLTLVGMGVGTAVGALRDRLTDRRPTPVSGAWLAAGVLTASVAVGVAARHEIAVRAAVDAPPIGVSWVLAVTAAPVLAAVAAVLIRPRVWAITALTGCLAVTAAPLPGQADAARTNVPDNPAMIYGPLTEPGAIPSRADRLVTRWIATGGLDRRAVVIAVPTGSGWVDAGAVEGVRRHFDDSVTVLALQYDDVPSWQAFVSSPDAAGRSATALLSAVDRRLDSVPSSQRPRVYLIGQSLGAVGADAARSWAATTGARLDGTVLAGPPAGTVEPLPRCARRVVLANPDDPVTVFGAALLWRPVARAENDEDRQRAGMLPWLPVVSMLGAALDLPAALDVPNGHGHRYGVEQGLAISAVPPGCQPMGPRAAS